MAAFCSLSITMLFTMYHKWYHGEWCDLSIVSSHTISFDIVRTTHINKHQTQQEAISQIAFYTNAASEQLHRNSKLLWNEKRRESYLT